MRCCVFRLWGDHGQDALETAHVCLINATATGTEILKNLVLPGKLVSRKHRARRALGDDKRNALCVCLSGIGAFTIVDGHTVTGDDVGNKWVISSLKCSCDHINTPLTIDLMLADSFFLSSSNIGKVCSFFFNQWKQSMMTKCSVMSFILFFSEQSTSRHRAAAGTQHWCVWKLCWGGWCLSCCLVASLFYFIFFFNEGVLLWYLVHFAFSVLPVQKGPSVPWCAHLISLSLPQWI